MGKIRITDTSLRDGHQSLWATRMSTDDMLPVLEILDNIGYHSLEVWGGATFDVCLRYLNEDPWERLKLIKERISKTKLQMLLRGQSLVGYAHYPDDVAEKFIHKAAEYGIDIFRVFDALNDIRNLETCVRAVKNTGKHVQACLVYTTSPVHTLGHFVDMAVSLQDMGADSICIKDMAGLLSPYAAYDLIKLLKENIRLPLQLHTHYIGGLAVATCIKAAEAGVDVIDTASVPLAFGSSQPPVETIVRALQESPWDTGLDLHALFAVAAYFEQLRKHKGFERGVTRISDMKVFEHQVPGGMISNFVAQLEEQKAAHRLEEVLEEIPQVRKDLGYPPLVTPTSQIIGTQAVLNVLLGERYKLCPGEVQAYVRGLYGQPPAPIDDSIRAKIIGDGPVIKGRPADLLEPGWEKGKQEMAEISGREEDVLAYLMFPQIARKFFEYRKMWAQDGVPHLQIEDQASQEMADGFEDIIIPPLGAEPAPLPIVRGDEKMKLEEIRDLILLLDSTSIAELEVQNTEFRLSLRKGGNPDRNQTSSQNHAAQFSPPPASGSVPEAADNLVMVKSPMVGPFYAASSPDAEPFVREGNKVTKGQTLCIVEAMKLMNEIKSELDGTIADITVENGQALEYGQTIFIIKKD